MKTGDETSKILTNQLVTFQNYIKIFIEAVSRRDNNHLHILSRTKIYTIRTLYSQYNSILTEPAAGVHLGDKDCRCMQPQRKKQTTH